MTKKRKKQKKMSEFSDYSAKEAADLLLSLSENKKKILFTGHRNPDGDCVGSSYAIKMIYKSLGGEAECAFPGKIPDYLSFLSGNCKNNENDISFDHVITIDTASPSQMGDLIYLKEKVILTIDHHENCTQFSDSYRDKDASAAGEQVYKIYKILRDNNKIKENANICRLIYSAISSDTGSFMYSNTTKETHKIAADLVETINSDKNGYNCATISQKLHNSRSLTALKAQKMCIEYLETTADAKIAFIVLEKQKIAENGLRDEDFGSAVDIPRSLEGVLLSFVLKETDETKENKDKAYKISARSSCDVNVADICAKFGGGGHAKAAGGTVFAKNAENAKNIIVEAFSKALEN